MRAKLLLIPILILFLAGASIGCARNTNSVKGDGTGLVINTPFGQVVLGHANFHSVTSDLQNERLTITDTTYYDAGADLTGDIGTVVGATQAVQRTYTMKLEPVVSDPGEPVE